MDYSPILIPVVALVAWSIVMMLWMLVTRLAEFKRMGVSLGTLPEGARGADLDARPEARAAQWKSHNYNHLMEQPTIFYAIALTLALMDMGSGTNYWLAWGYVAFRVIHSLIQATVNVVLYRFTAFFFASLCLVGLTIHAAARILHDCGIL